MSQRLARGQAALLGMIVLAGLALAGWGLFTLHERRVFGGESFMVRAGFADIGGVEAGTRVRIQGIDAGEVEYVILPSIPGQKVQLALRLKESLHYLVTSDATAQIVPESLIAGKILRIMPGSSEPVADNGILAAVDTPELADELADSAARLKHVLTEADQALAEFRTEQGSMVRDLTQATTRLNTVLTRIDATMDDLQKGQGTIGQLVQSKEIYSEAMQSLQETRKMVASVKQNSDAIKTLPVIRSYVVDSQKLLVRPDWFTYRQSVAIDKLFEKDRAVLTATGRKELDRLAPWLNENHGANSEVVIAAFATTSQDPDFAEILTQKQADAVMDYLKSTAKIQRTGWWWWSNRSVRAVGVGSHPPAIPGTEKLPSARVDLVVFVPGS